MRFTDKALYRAAMGYAKSGGSIVNGLLVEKLLGLIKKWLKDPDYVFWLGRCGEDENRQIFKLTNAAILKRLFNKNS
jgi:hypothetical protein